MREAGHPLPDARSVAAAAEALDLAAGAAPPAQLLVLLSGGASAIWCAPAAGLTLADKLATTDALLRSGAEIAELNSVRKHLSRIKGGRLALAAGTRELLTLAISDVRGDHPDQIGSGPTVADPTRYADALDVLRRHGIASQVPVAVRSHLEAGAAGAREETPKSIGHGRFRVVASLAQALEAAVERARALGRRVSNEGAFAYGEVGEVARDLAQRVRRAARAGVEVLVGGGEPVVRVRGPGRGGRAQELALRLALELDGEPELAFSALCAGTDGSDGPTDAAGGLVDAHTLERAARRGLAARAALERSDSYALLDAAGALLRTGPTQTNVADVVLVRVAERG
jgi:glycerate-2-kinase